MLILDRFLQFLGIRTFHHGIITHTTSDSRKLIVVCISDTHGLHRQLEMPAGDILIHAGDYTLYGDTSHLHDFNLWLGELPYKHILVVHGNHEYNSPWIKNAKEHLSNAVVLGNECIVVEGLKVFGTGFFWSCKGRNPYLDCIESGMDVIVAHNPPLGYGDTGKKGCPALLERVGELKPVLVISGHAHEGRGVSQGKNDVTGVTFVNAAVVNKSRVFCKQPIVIKL